MMMNQQDRIASEKEKNEKNVGILFTLLSTFLLYIYILLLYLEKKIAELSEC